MPDTTHRLPWITALSVLPAAAMAWLLAENGRPGAHLGLAWAFYLYSFTTAIGHVYLYRKRSCSLLTILLPALVLRAAMLPMQPSDDVNRYIWEGRIAAAGYSPYMLAPDSSELSHLRDDLHAGVNHPGYTAIYPPGFTLLMQVLTPAATPMTVKLMMSVADLLLIAVLAALLRRRKRTSWTFLYALHPLPLLAFAGEGHLDVLMMLFLLLAVLLYRQRIWPLMFICLAASVHMKYMALAAVPFMLTRDSLKWIWLFLTALLLPVLNFAEPGLFDSLYAFGTSFAYNGSLHAVISGVLPAAWTTLILATGWLIFTLHAALLRQHPETVLSTVFALLLFFSPTVHYWYLSWFLPFLCFRPTRAWILWSLLIAGTFVSQHHMLQDGVWLEYGPVTWLTYLPVCGLLLYDLFFYRARQSTPAVSTDPLPTFTVIIPVQDRLEQLQEAVAALSTELQSDDRLLTAGDGHPDVTSWCQHNGLNITHSATGRGQQIAAAAEKVETDYILILHADCRLEPGTLLNLKRQLQTTGSRWGAVGGTFSSTTPAMRLISLLNRLRADGFGMSFGDQGQFVHTGLLKQAGGFPDQSIMEDVELCLRCSEYEPPFYFGGGIVISPASWNRSASRLRRILLILRLFYGYLLKRIIQTKPDTTAMYQKYYESA